MFKKKELTLPEWQAFENEKRAQLAKNQAEIERLTREIRPALLLRLADEDELAADELAQCDQVLAKLKTETESIEVLLQAIPARMAYAQGVAVEALIPQIEKMKAGLPALLEEIQKKSAALTAANEKLLEYLRGFEDLEATQNLHLRTEYIRAGWDNFPSKPRGDVAGSGEGEILMSVVLGGIALDTDLLTTWGENTQKAIADRLEKMHDHARRLKGEKLPPPEWAYCPECYKLVGYPDQNGKYRCSGCGKTF